MTTSLIDKRMKARTHPSECTTIDQAMTNWKKSIKTSSTASRTTTRTSCQRMSRIFIWSCWRQPACSLNKRSSAEARDLVRRKRVSRGSYPIARSLVFHRRSRGKVRGKTAKGKCGMSTGKGQTKDNKAYLREAKANNSNNNSGWRSWPPWERLPERTATTK